MYYILRIVILLTPVEFFSVSSIFPRLEGHICHSLPFKPLNKLHIFSGCNGITVTFSYNFSMYFNLLNNVAVIPLSHWMIILTINKWNYYFLLVKKKKMFAVSIFYKEIIVCFLLYWKMNNASHPGIKSWVWSHLGPWFVIACSHVARLRVEVTPP